MRPILLCLHGWGGSKESFDELRAALDGCDIEILTPDFPGFGDAHEPDRPWTVDDYAEWVEQESGIRNQESVMILGHSFGGRIALKLATRGNLKIHHLFLCASAGIYRPRKMKRAVGFMLAKTGKAFFSLPGLRCVAGLARTLLYKLLREHDYELATPRMQETHLRVVGEDLRPLLEHITVPTDIFWGTEDTMTPVEDAYIMHKEIPGSTLHVFEDIGHRVHRDRAEEIAAVVKKEVRSEK